jgi:hypothetical protein
MGTGHLVMGELTDYLTGNPLPDTHDERILQEISRFLVEKKGWPKKDVPSRRTLSITVDGKPGRVRVHFILRIRDMSFMAVLYGPGSVVTRERPALAVARLMEPAYIVPYCTVTNGQDASVMDSRTGKVIGKNLDAVFSRDEAMEKTADFVPEALTDARRAKEERILYAMDILTKAECSEFSCSLPF